MSQAIESRASRWLRPESLVQAIGIAIMMTVFSRGAGLVRTVIFARLLDRAELGAWAITSNTIQMLSIILVFGIPGALSRYVVRYQQEGRLRSFILQTTLFSLGGGLAAVGFGIVFCRPLARLFYEDAGQAPLMVLTCLGTFAAIAFNIIQGVLQGLRVNRLNAMMLVAQSVGFAALGGLLLAVWQPTAIAGAWAFLLVSIVVTGVPCFLLWNHVRAEPVVAKPIAAACLWRPILMFSMGTWAASSLYALWTALDRYLLLHFDTLDSTERLREIGTYHIIENVTAPLLALGGGWCIQVLAHSVHLWETHRTREADSMIQLATKLSVLALTLAAAVLIVLKRLVLAGIFGDVSMASGEILELVLVAIIMVVAQGMLRCYLLCREQAWRMTAVWALAVATSFGLNLVLIPVFHLRGAAVTAMVSSSVATGFILWLAHRAGLRLTTNTIAVCSLPAVLLLPANQMLLGLVATAVLILRTDWLLSAEEKSIVNDRLQSRLAGRAAQSGLAAT